MINFDKYFIQSARNLSLILLAYDFVISVYWFSIVFIIFLSIILVKSALKYAKARKNQNVSFEKKDFVSGIVLSLILTSAIIFTPAKDSLIFSRITQVEKIRNYLQELEAVTNKDVGFGTFPTAAIKKDRSKLLELEFHGIDPDFFCSTTARYISRHGPLNDSYLIEKIILEISKLSKVSPFCEKLNKLMKGEASADEIDYLTAWIENIYIITGRKSISSPAFLKSDIEIYEVERKYNFLKDQAIVQASTLLKKWECLELLETSFSDFTYFLGERSSSKEVFLAEFNGKKICKISKDNSKLLFEYFL